MWVLSSTQSKLQTQVQPRVVRGDVGNTAPHQIHLGRSSHLRLIETPTWCRVSNKSGTKIKARPASNLQMHCASTVVSRMIEATGVAGSAARHVEAGATVTTVPTHLQPTVRKHLQQTVPKHLQPTVPKQITSKTRVCGGSQQQVLRVVQLWVATQLTLI